MELDILELEDTPLGAILNSDKSATLRVWSPNASEVFVMLFNKDNPEILIPNFIGMEKNNKGIWSVILNYNNCNIHDLDGYYYQYLITENGVKSIALDPYAKSMASFTPNSKDIIGKACIVDLESDRAGIKPQFIGNTNLKNRMDMVVYEIHVRDFTSNEEIEGRGTFKGFCNFTKGIEHLKDLGITHVQLLPIHNFYTVNEENKDYSEEWDCNTNYNWGYDPHNYFTIEGWYCTNPSDPYNRIKEFRELVNKLHDNNIGVIMDVVFNHTYENSILHNVSNKEYYRNKGGATPVGDSALASEKPIVRKLIIDSLNYFVKHFGVDGFRFDLMGFIDSETLLMARKVLGSKVILYGEAWNFTDLNSNLAPIKGETNFFNHKISELGYFNDTLRDSVTGFMENPGFVQGNFNDNPRCKAGIIGNLKDFNNGSQFFYIDNNKYNRFAIDPSETIQYLTIHDGFTLWDKINISYKGNKEEKLKIIKQAVAILFTSQGRVVIHGGSEIARTKPLAKNDIESGRVNKNINNVIDEGFGLYFHENSYRSPDFTNKIRWERKEDPDIYKLYLYNKGLIKLRRSISCFRYCRSENIINGLRFFGDTKDNINCSYIAYTLDNKLEGSKECWSNIVVIHNADSDYLNLPTDIHDITEYSIIVDGDNAGTNPILDSKVIIKKGSIQIPPHTSAVLAK